MNWAKGNYWQENYIWSFFLLLASVSLHFSNFFEFYQIWNFLVVYEEAYSRFIIR